MPPVKKHKRSAINNLKKATEARLRRGEIVQVLRQAEDSIPEPEAPPPPPQQENVELTPTPPAPKEKNEVCIFCAQPTYDIHCYHKRDILRHVLGVSEQQLQSSKTPPPFGSIKICENCALLAKEGLGCVKQIEMLQNTLKNVQEVLKRKVQSSTKTFNKTKQTLEQPQVLELYQRVRNLLNGITHERPIIAVPAKKQKLVKRLVNRRKSRKQNLASSSTTYVPLSPLDVNCMDFDVLPEVETEITFHSNSTAQAEDPLALDNLSVSQPLESKSKPIFTASSEPSTNFVASELSTKPAPKSVPECPKSMPQIAAAIVSKTKSMPQIAAEIVSKTKSKPTPKLPKNLAIAVKYEVADKNGKFWCRICKEMKDTALDVVQHRKFIHPDLAICTGLPNLCCLKIFRATELKRHRKEQHALFQCDVENCIHSFSSHFFKILHYFQRHPELPQPSPGETKNVKNFVKPVSEEEIGRIVTPVVLLDNNSVIKEENLDELKDMEFCVGKDFEDYEKFLGVDNLGGPFVIKDESIDEEMELEESFDYLDEVEHFQPEAYSSEIEDEVAKKKQNSNFEKEIETNKEPEFSQSFSRFPENLEENVSESQQNPETDEKDEELRPENPEIENEIVEKEKSPVPEFPEKSTTPATATEPFTKSTTKSNVSESSISEFMSKITETMIFNLKLKTYIKNKTTKLIPKSSNNEQVPIIPEQKSEAESEQTLTKEDASIPFDIKISKDKWKNRLATIPSISPPPKQGSQKCGLCCMVFKSVFYLVTHLKEKHASACVFGCDVCKRRFDTETQLQLHMTNQHPKPLKTYPGKKVVPQSAAAVKEPQPFLPFADLRCSTCNKQFLDVNEFCNHSHKLPESEISTTFLCDVEGCGKAFKDKARLRSHQVVNHKMANIPYNCTYCGQNFRIHRHWKEHVVIHTGINPYKCKKCPATFPKQSRLNRHNLLHMADPYRYVCNLCPKKFTNSKGLKTHRAIHFDERPFLCWECGKTFKTHNNLYIHRWSHDPDRKTKYSPYMKNQKKSEEAAKRRQAKNDAKNKNNSVPSSTVTSGQVQEPQTDEIQIHDQNQNTPEPETEPAACLTLVQSNQTQTATEF